MSFPRSPVSIMLLAAAALACLAALFPGWLTPYDPNGIDATALLEGPSWRHPLGTDELGTDVLARIIYGTRLEVGIAIGSVALAALMAVPAGLWAGYRGGKVDWLFTLIADSILSFPIVLFAVMIVASLGASVGTLIGVLAFVFLPRIFRLVRGQTQVLKATGYVKSARALGVGTLAILFRHILPNALGPILVIVPQLMAIAVLIEAGLSFVGLGVQPPQISWGSLLLVSKNYYTAAIWYPVSVGAVTTLASAALVFGGDVAAAAVNPSRRSA
jgi:peptide/nickel transport system permease protein